MWPGYGENSRVLKWITERIEGVGNATETAIGYVPGDGAIDLNGIDITQETMSKLSEVDKSAWIDELALIREHYAQFGDRLPTELAEQLDTLEQKLNK